MKTHIISFLLMNLGLAACASYEGRNISSIDKEKQEDQAQQAFFLERYNAREMGVNQQ